MARQTGERGLPLWVILILVGSLGFFLKLMVDVIVKHGDRQDLILIEQGRQDEDIQDNADEIRRLRDGK